ncbi:LysR family transcriptional regulator [Actinomadura sp. KC216]|uniref:LysR family transcriptional regulator n=1 Tax=Actinomadura sp. KC216 TaxID=2530370 RepID=UPI001043B8CE|nr:LysR family transcriptional regulator [Actinomadura sp. KC216]TDB87926.1 LysR family transcriptional regulator [Actinomadura sp. KC216]
MKSYVQQAAGGHLDLVALHLRVFHAAARLGSFRKAAEELYLSQPTVSFHIQHLERALGIPLFTRSHRKVTLTPAGMLLYDHSTDVLAATESLAARLGELTGKFHGRLAIGLTNLMSSYVLPRIIGAFLAQHKDVKVVWNVAGSGAVLKSLLDGEVDIGIVAEPIDRGDLVAEEFFRDHHVVVAPPRHRWCLEERKIALNDLLEEPLIVQEPGSCTYTGLASYLDANGLSLSSCNVVLEVNNSESVKALVEAGLGIAVLPRTSVVTEFRAGTLSELRIEGDPIEHVFSVVYHRNKPLKGVAKAFLDFLHLRGPGETAETADPGETADDAVPMRA